MVILVQEIPLFLQKGHFKMVLESINRIDIRTLTSGSPEAAPTPPDIAREITPEVWEGIAVCIKECLGRGGTLDSLELMYHISLLDPAKLDEMELPSNTNERIARAIKAETYISDSASALREAESSGWHIQMLARVAPEYLPTIGHTDISYLVENQIKLDFGPTNVNAGEVLYRLSAIDRSKLPYLVNEEGIQRIQNELHEDSEDFRQFRETLAAESIGGNFCMFRVLFPDRYNKGDLDPSFLETLKFQISRSLADFNDKVSENIELEYDDLRIVLPLVSNYRILTAETVEVKNGIIHINMSPEEDLPKPEEMPEERSF
jgi:hypothetical protein